MHGKAMGWVVVCLLAAQGAQAQACLRPIPPYVPEQADDIRAYSGLLRRDMERYFADVQRYFRCFDAERGAVFEEARRVTEEYGQVLEVAE